MQTAADYVKKIKSFWGGYWLGCYGLIATLMLWLQKSTQLGLISWYRNNAFAKALWMGKPVYDCVGLDKAARWIRPDGTIPRDKLTDLSDQGIYDLAIKLGLPHGPMSTLPLIEGIALRFPGHFGVLIQVDGVWYGKEARSASRGVVQYKIGEPRPGTTNQWTEWFYNPFLDYGGDMIICKRGDGSIENPDQLVLSFQKGLEALGIKMIGDDGIEYKPDGSYGGASSNGLETFQKKYGLPVNGDFYDTTSNAVMLLQLAAKKDYKAELDLALKKIATLEAQIVSLNTQIASLKKQLADSTAKNVELANKLILSESENAKLEEQLKIVTADRDAKLSELTFIGKAQDIISKY